MDEERLRGARPAWRWMAVRALAAVYSYRGAGVKEPDTFKR